MKLLLLLSIVILFNSCVENSQESLIGKQFSDHKRIAALEDFEKVSDTTFYINQEIEKEYSLLNLKKANTDLIVYSLINSDPNEKRSYTILDTLMINSKKSEKITIGYCEFNLRNQSAGNIIALVETIDNKKMFNQSIKAAWSANSQTEKIEHINNLKNIQCLNAWYDGESETITYDELED
ncbi:hypothetical protein MKO06_08695 [Gramella sp. GC03-9]|uniref:Uncharacterized protein n=1 Tax=Christiangramia oceanisediminis TaxID=2920386 RepID=A0A9X2I5W6_9FLAO|nr:hypothetical protein [Gramella oceanisediminis]MCP9199982.1 hypothetical protein [Gramella oceanisediminis]